MNLPPPRNDRPPAMENCRLYMEDIAMRTRSLGLLIALSTFVNLWGLPISGQAGDPPQPTAEGDVQSRGLSLPNIAPPPPPPPPPQVTAPALPVPSTVPVVNSLKVVIRPRCDTRQLQPHQIAKPCSRVTSTSSTIDTESMHILEFRGKNLLSPTLSIVNGPSDINIHVGDPLSRIQTCPPGACLRASMRPHQGTQRGPRTLQIKNPQGQTTTVQIEVVDGLVINVPPRQPGTAAQPAQSQQLPPCPPLSSTGQVAMRPGGCR